uniref:C2 domain-containing protein n=1 Tax=Parascaris univalens TaxID=6257 RepID=A0A915AJ13_PARUN
MFRKTVDEEFLLNHVGEMELPVADESGKMVVEMRGKCFNATLTVEKHEKRCPWCTEHNEVAIVGQQAQDEEATLDFMHYLGAGDQFMYLTVVALATIAIASSAAFACLLVAFLRQKRSTELLKCNKARFGVYHDNCQRVHVESLHGSDDSSRYETPWDQKYYPLPHWLSNRGDVNSTSAQETASTLTGPMSNQNSRTTVGGSHLKVSPNTTVSDHHDDSGLESV